MTTYIGEQIDEQSIIDSRLQEKLRGIITHDDYAGLLNLQDELGDVLVRIDDETGHFPESTYPLAAIQAEPRKRGDLGAGIRFFLKAANYDPHHPGRQFTFRTNNLGALSIAGRLEASG